MTKTGEIKLLKTGIFASLLVVISILLSGPIGMPLVFLTKPQPQWTNPESFVANFHYMQTLPYFIGFLLTFGSVLLISTIYKLSSEDNRLFMFPSIIFASVYASLISFNYIIQTTFVPAVVTHYSNEYGIVISAFSMSNPNSLAWAIEMYGYGFLGISLLFLLPYFKEGHYGKMLSLLLALNALVSIVGALATSVQLSWVLSTLGLVCFFAWNILYLIIICMIGKLFRNKLKTI